MKIEEISLNAKWVSQQKIIVNIKIKQKNEGKKTEENLLNMSLMLYIMLDFYSKCGRKKGVLIVPNNQYMIKSY